MTAALSSSAVARAGSPQARRVEHSGCVIAFPPPAPALPLPDIAAVRQLGIAFCLEHGILPLIRRGAVRPVLMDAAAAGDQALAERVGAAIEPITPVISAKDAVRARLMALLRAEMIDTAETRVDAADSCRSNPFSQAAPVLATLALALVFALIVLPGSLGAALLWLGLAVVSANAMLGAVALALSFHPVRTPAHRAAEQSGIESSAAVPVISLFVPLFRETAVLARLVERLGRLDYPADRLDILLICEEGDAAMREALQAMPIPETMRVIAVPRGTVQTKPRAMNYALNFARGAIVGIYDAEDAPEADQLYRVVHRFAAEGPRTACLQGALAFYNSADTWITRAFALDYAIWFRAVLPALSRLDAVVPLGGTTVFLRRDPLEEIGGWDAHNVTEDADLGVRLRRRGYRCALFDGTTMEEATSHAWPWIRQRSRWLKGYALTWAVHMRRPGRLWQEIGPGGFLWFQLLFLGALSGFALAPFLWLFWLHAPFAGFSLLPEWAPGGPWMATPLVFAATVQLVGALRATKIGRLGAGHAIWAPALWPYFVLGTVAVYKALGECVVNPFYWDKTAHGISPRANRG